MDDLRILEAKTARAIAAVKKEIFACRDDADTNAGRRDEMLKELRDALRGVEAKVELIPVFMKDVNDLKVESRDTREVTIKTQVLVAQVVSQLDKFPPEKMARDLDAAHGKIREHDTAINEHQMRMVRLERKPEKELKDTWDKIKLVVVASLVTATIGLVLRTIGIV